MRRVVAHAGVQPVLSLIILATVGFASEVLGLRLGMSPAAVGDLFGESGISLVRIDAETWSASRPLTPLEGVAGVKLSFDREALHKISVFFDIPPREPTAHNLISLF